MYGLSKSVCVVPVIQVCAYILLPCVCLCFCMSVVISSFNTLKVGSHVFALLMLFLCVILHTIWSGKSLQLLCHLHFGMLCLPAISMMFVQIMLAVCMLVAMVFNNDIIIIIMILLLLLVEVMVLCLLT